MSLPITTRADPDGTVWTRPHGEVDLDNAYLLRDAVTVVLAAGKARRIVVDLGAVPLIDSVGVGVLASCFYAAAACGVPLAAANPSPTVSRQLWVCGLTGLFGLTVPVGQPGQITGSSPVG